MPSQSNKPDISVVVVVYNMAREAPRTLQSLSASYQRDIAADDFEIIVIDNGSSPALDPKVLDGLDGNFRLIRIDNASPSPAKAVNRGLNEARGRIVGVMIDGARLVTPGVLHFARNAGHLYERPVVVTLGYYLGFDMQRWSTQAGYDAAREDALLASIAWPQDGYRLFEIATVDESCVNDLVQPIAETNALFLPRSSWDLLGGVEERFDSPGGGFLNLDMLRRAMELPESRLVTLLGEGTFHQLHGGIATNADPDILTPRVERWRKQYETIRGEPWKPLKASVEQAYLGTLPRPVLAALARATVEPYPLRSLPLGATFDRSLWAAAKTAPPKDPTVAAMMALAEKQFIAGFPGSAATVARMARAHAPDELAPQHFLVRAGPFLALRNVPAVEGAAFHYSLGEAHRLLGSAEEATAGFLKALAIDGDCVEAHLGLAMLRYPGQNYLTHLANLHKLLSPEVYLEVGVATGATLALARPPTLAIGIDPEPEPNVRLNTQSYIFAEESDKFFNSGKLSTVLAGRSVGLAFIDGLHVCQQALRDFMNVERACGPRAVVLFHDTIPLDETTQRPERQRRFYTGDIWKTILCLKHYRPDLDIVTIPTMPSGLTMVTGLDAESNVLHERYDEAVSRFADLPYSAIENDIPNALNLVSNDWNGVLRHLRERRIIATV